MAWCFHCAQDRPIQRQTFDNRCSFCSQDYTFCHHVDCRGPVAGALDVCTYCNTPLFAKAHDKATYDLLKNRESRIVGSAWSLMVRHGSGDISPERAKIMVDYIKSHKIIEAVKGLREVNPCFGLAEAKNIVDAVGRELGVVKPSGGCMGMLILIPYCIIMTYFRR